MHDTRLRSRDKPVVDYTDIPREDNRKCMAKVEITGPPALESWYHIWEEMVAIEGMCTRAGLSGTASALGMSCSVIVLLVMENKLEFLLTDDSIGSRRNIILDVIRPPPSNVATD